jgi:hypothetical protein
MDEDDEDPVPLPNVNAAILKRVISICVTISLELFSLTETNHDSCYCFTHHSVLSFINVGDSMGDAP